MPRGDKTLAAMRSNLRDWRIKSLESVAAAAAVNIRKSGGNHVVFEHPELAEALVGSGPPPDEDYLCPTLRSLNRTGKRCR